MFYTKILNNPILVGYNSQTSFNSQMDYKNKTER
jgi:hypothetical protein